MGKDFVCPNMSIGVNYKFQKRKNLKKCFYSDVEALFFIIFASCIKTCFFE